MSINNGLLRVGQLGAQFELEALDVINIDGIKILQPFDLTNASIVEIEFNYGITSKIKTAVKESRGTSWFVKYDDPVVGPSILDASGKWTMRIIATMLTGEKIPLSSSLFAVGE